VFVIVGTSTGAEVANSSVATLGSVGRASTPIYMVGKTKSVGVAAGEVELGAVDITQHPQNRSNIPPPTIITLPRVPEFQRLPSWFIYVSHEAGG